MQNENTSQNTLPLTLDVKPDHQLEAIQAVVHTLAWDLSQPLTLLQLELDFITELGQTPTSETFERLQQAIKQIRSHLRAYQSITSYKTAELAGFTILDINRASSKANQE